MFKSLFYLLFVVLIFTFTAQSPLPAQDKPRETAKLIGREKIIDFSNYTFEILTLRDKDDASAYKQFRATFKGEAHQPAKIQWKLNATQANELLAYLKKFDELKESETSRTSAQVQTRIGRVENCDLFFTLFPNTSTKLQITDRTSPEINAQISYNDLQAMRRLLAEFVESSS